jgi:hypothetical protein
MKKGLFVAVVFTLIFVVLGPPAASWAAGSTVFKSTASSKSATAFFESIDSSVCNTGITTDVSVEASNGMSQTPPGPRTLSSIVTVFVSQFDTCTSTPILCIFGSASLADADFKVNAQSATLNTQLTAIDCDTGNPIDMSINVSWKANGQPTPSNFREFFQTPRIIDKSSGHATVTPAQASGTVSDGTTNFTPTPTVDASIASTINGELHISH